MVNFSDQIRTSLVKLCTDKATEIAEEYGRQFVSYIKYEFTVAQMELASSWEKHGYDFKFMPEQFIQNIRTETSQTDTGVSLKVTIPSENFLGESDSKVNFFQTYVVNNAAQKMNFIRKG